LKLTYLQNYNAASNQISHSNKDRQVPVLFVIGLNKGITNPRWWKAAILEKNRKIAISQQRFDRSLEIWRDDAF